MFGMKGFLKEFKTFAMRGNVVDLAIGIVIGAAFGKIVTSLVENIVTPLIGLILGGVNLTHFSLTLGSTTVAYGVFLQSIIDFVIVAFAIFVAIKLMNNLRTKEEKTPESKKLVEPTEEVKLLREIRDLMQK